MPAKIYTDQEASKVLEAHYQDNSIRAKYLGKGEWSQAFAFSKDGKDLVLRLGDHQQDFLKDQNAYRYRSGSLPIPRVLELGKFQDSYFAISERVTGTMLDSLPAARLQQTMPAILAMLDTIRESDISGTQGHGVAGVNRNAPYSSWPDYLLDVARDPSHDQTFKINGWRKNLTTDPKLNDQFDETFAALEQLASRLPDTRYLVHNDLLNRNVLVENDKISGVIDWANALYGDFLYDLGQFAFWSYHYPSMRGIDWENEAQVHFESIGLKVPQFSERMLACKIHLGLDAQRYYAFTMNWDSLEQVGERTHRLALFKG